MIRSVWVCAGLLSGAPFCQAQSPDTADWAVMPAASTQSIQYSPITEKQRLQRYLKETVNPVSLLSSAASAGIGQWRNRPMEWRQGSQGYGYRFGSAYAGHIVKTTLEFGASSVLQEDTRYIPSGLPGAGERTRYAVSSAFMARRRDGARRVSLAKIGALAGAALISRIWQPRSSNGLGGAAANFGTSIAVAASFNVVREFWPHRP